MTLLSLAEEYEKSAEKLNKRVANLVSLEQISLGKEKYLLRKRIRILNDMARECKNTARYLRSYYEKKLR